MQALRRLTGLSGDHLKSQVKTDKEKYPVPASGFLPHMCMYTRTLMCVPYTKITHKTVYENHVVRFLKRLHRTCKQLPALNDKKTTQIKNQQSLGIGICAGR